MNLNRSVISWNNSHSHIRSKPMRMSGLCLPNHHKCFVLWTHTVCATTDRNRQIQEPGSYFVPQRHKFCGGSQSDQGWLQYLKKSIIRRIHRYERTAVRGFFCGICHLVDFRMLAWHVIQSGSKLFGLMHGLASL